MKYLLILLLFVSCNTNEFKEVKVKTYKIDSSEYIPLQKNNIDQFPYWKLYFHDSTNGKLQKIWFISYNNDTIINKYIIVNDRNNCKGYFYKIER